MSAIGSEGRRCDAASPAADAGRDADGCIIPEVGKFGHTGKFGDTIGLHWSGPLERDREWVTVLLEEGWMAGKQARRFDRTFKLAALARMA
ncbi:MAG: hypothetical protein AB7O95_24665, partial [Geminicoccaceae bacterium]